MVRTLFVPLLATLSWAQTAAPPPAPPQPSADVDRALRARVKAFYDLLVNHQYRKAEELVAPDSREIYYEGDKPRYLKYEVKSIKYSEDFTRADVVVTVKLPLIGLILTPIDTDITGVWRLLDGAWYWSLPKINVVDHIRAMAGGGPASPGTQAAAIPPLMPGNTGLLPSLPSAVNLPGGMGRPESIPMMGVGESSKPQFNMDRAQVTLKPSTTEKVTITNASSAPMTLFLLGKLTGIEATFDHPLIQPGEKAVLSLQASAGAKDGVLVIGVTETKAVASLQVFVK